MGEDVLLQLAEGLDLVIISADEVLVQFGTRSFPSELLRDTELSGYLGELAARLLRGPATPRQLLAEFSSTQCADARSLIQELVDHGILAEVGRNPVDQYLGYTFEGDSTLTDRRVALIGAGPVGARVAHSLLLAGVGRIQLLDERRADGLWDVFSPFGGRPDDNPERWAHQALRDRLRAMGHPGVEAVEGRLDARTIEGVLARAHFVVVALEQPNLRATHLVNRFCLRDHKPWMLATIDGNFGLVGPLFIPIQTACFSDYRMLSEAATPSPEMARKHRQSQLRRAAGSFFPGLPAYAEIVAGYASLATTHFLLRGTSYLVGRVFAIDFDRMVCSVEDVLKLPRCPVCGGQKSAYRPPIPMALETRPGEVG